MALRFRLKRLNVRHWLLYVVLITLLIASFFMVPLLDLDDPSSVCGGGRCLSGMAIYASRIFLAGLIVVLKVKDWIEPKLPNVRREARFRSFLRQYEQGQTRIDTVNRGLRVWKRAKRK